MKNSSLKELSKTLPKIEVEGNGSFLVTVKHNGVEIANVMVSIDELVFTPNDLIKSHVKLTAIQVY